MKCKQCQQDKPKIKAETRPVPQRGYYYRDDQGRLWQGNICPDCFYPLNQGFHRIDKDEEELHEDRHYEADPLTTRVCRKCLGFLPKSRYFRHEECEVKNICFTMEGLGWI